MTTTDRNHTSQVEIERKYAVDEGHAVPALTGIGAATGTPVTDAVALDAFELEATYYDTETLALAQHRIALRRRRGGHDEGWHVKLPAEEGRTELQWPLGDSEGAGVPDEVADAVRALVRDRELTPLARIRTTRRVTELRNAEGAVVVELSDDTVEGSDARHGRVTLWREWEAELGAGAPGTAAERAALLDEVERQLLAAGATVSPSVSKLAQALGRTGLGAPEPDDEGTGDAAPGVAGSADSAGDAGPADAAGGAVSAEPSAEEAADLPAPTRVVLTGIAALVEDLIAIDPAVRADDEDAVHRARTTVRRIKNLLAVHRSLFDPATVARLRDELGSLGSALGEVRDLEVRVDWARIALNEWEAERGLDDPAARRRLIEEPGREHDEAHARLVGVLSRAPYFRLLDALEEFVAPAAEASRSTARRIDGVKGGAKGGGKSAGKARGKGGGKADRKAAEKAARKAAEKAARKAEKAVEETAERSLRKTARRAVARTVAAGTVRVLRDPAVEGGDLVQEATALGALHESRKAVRRLRHAAEFVTDGPAAVLGGRAEELGDTAEELQDALGLHRDAALFAEYLLLTAPRAEAAGESGFTYGVLYQRALDQARRALSLADDSRRALKKRAKKTV